MCAMTDGRQISRSTGATNKKVAQQVYDAWKVDIAQGQFNLLKKAPKLKAWAERYLKTVQHPNTRKRYECSKENLVAFFGEDTQLDHLSIARIEQFKQKRHADAVKSSTINRDLRFLAQILKQAERERYLARSPFDLTKFFLNESRDRRKPHILTWKEQEALLAVASPRLRVLIVLGTETGMTTGEMLKLRWNDIDFLNDVIQVGQSKTAAGVRAVPVSADCKKELIRWRNLVGGSDFSEWIFPNFAKRRHPLQRGGRKAWANALRKAGLLFFPIYNLRHTFASRLTTAGVSPLTIAHMLGHSSTQIVPRYAQVMDENRLDAMKKLEALQQAAAVNQVAEEAKRAESAAETRDNGIRQ